jgi:hypothetical protein
MAVINMGRGWVRIGLACLVAVALAACGGGDSKDLLPGGSGPGGDDSGEPEETVQASVAMTMTDSSGVVVGTADRPITSNRPARVRVMVSDGQGGLSNQVVNFNSTIAEIVPATATALTDANGVAQITLEAGEDAGAGMLTASATVNGQLYERSMGFQTAGGGDNDNGDGGDTGETTVLLGHGSGANFEEGMVGLSATQISAKSTLSAIINLVTSDNNAPWGGSTSISFSSSCAIAGKASFDPQEVVPVAGTAVTSYQAENGCTEDVITASATLSGQFRTASSDTITIEQSPPASLTFLGAEPPVIGLKGSAQIGAPESSVLRFQVKDSNGDPATAGEAVNFSVASDNGGFAITSDLSASTNAQGIAEVTVRSGTVPFSAFVLAELDENTDISATGSVSVQSGPITQSRFSLALETLNPKAGSHQGVEVPVNVRAADRFGNWAPDGTRINFTAELGDIEGSCETVDGTCSVVWTSQAVQTHHYDANRDARSCFSGTGPEREQSGLSGGVFCGDFDRFGRNTITAWTVGEESFSDSNGNNLFDVGESWLALPEAFRDDNETGIRDDNAPFTEEFMDYNSDGAYDSEGAVFRGLGCGDDALVAGNCESLANVRDSAIMTLSDDTLRVNIVESSENLSDAYWASSSQSALTPQNWGDAALWGVDTLSVLEVSPGANSYAAVISDVNGNAPFQGLFIYVSAEGKIAGGEVECKVENTTEAVVCPFTILAPLDPDEFDDANFSAVTVRFAYPTANTSYPGRVDIPVIKAP